MRILVKKRIITENEIRELEVEILKEESEDKLSAKEMQSKEELNEEYDMKLVNKIKEVITNESQRLQIMQTH